MPKARIDGDPEVFLEKINNLIDGVHLAIGNYIEDLVSFASETLDDLAWRYWGPGGSVFVGILQKMLEDYIAQISDAWVILMEEIEKLVGAILGNPLKIIEISSAYKDAVQELGNVTGAIENSNNYISDYWEGRAVRAYRNTSASQGEALVGTTVILTAASNLLDDHAVALLKFWNEHAQALRNLGTEIVDRVIDMAELENVVSGGTLGVIGLLAGTSSTMGEVVTNANDYWLTLNVGLGGDWDTVQSQIPLNGLKDDKWPEFSSYLTNQDESYINGPWQLTT